MDYRKYRSIGCGIIGSGSIESAHRTVIQKRMKLSGQHWSKPGSQNMLRLRVIAMNRQWHKVIEILKILLVGQLNGMRQFEMNPMIHVLSLVKLFFRTFAENKSSENNLS
jgi:hypothetical protein